MDSSIQFIPYSRLFLALIPALAVIGILHRWSVDGGNALYSLLRMVVQLLMVGYVLVYIFRTDNSWVVLTVLSVMVFASSWIALRTIRERRRALYIEAVIATLGGGGATLVLVTQGVLSLDPWYFPRYFIPLAGMIFAGVMNSISLAAERLVAEIDKGSLFPEARSIALNAALIPIINSLFAVGLVSLPGMMTGQILSGISPLVAVNYQILVMLMIFTAAGLSTVCFLVLVRSEFK